MTSDTGPLEKRIWGYNNINEVNKIFETKIRN